MPSTEASRNANEVSVNEAIAATPETLYDLVSDVTNISRWSPENTGCRWAGGATRPSVGARFRGANRRGWRRWSTTCTVREAEPGRRFAFDVRYFLFPISRWTYEFAPDGAGTRVTESWADRRPWFMARVLAPTVMGVRDQATFNREQIKGTLSALKRFAESS